MGLVDQELPTAADRARLGVVLSRWPDWDAALPAAPVLLGKLGGLSNDNYLVRGGDARFVVRLNDDKVDLGVDRDLERRVLASIAGEPFAPRVVYAAADCLVTAYIEGGHPAEPHVTAMGALFSRIHAMSPPAGPALDPLAHLAGYLRRLPARDARLEACFETLDARRTATAAPVCLCHNDLLLENVVDTGAGLVAIDWEYARPGDPAFDIAVFAHTYELTGDAVDRLLAVYGGDDAGLADRITWCRGAYALIEVCWWLLRGRNVDAQIQQLWRRMVSLR